MTTLDVFICVKGPVKSVVTFCYLVWRLMPYKGLKPSCMLLAFNIWQKGSQLGLFYRSE